MKIACIDIGTNALRVEIYDVSDLRKPQGPLYKERLLLKLGDGIYQSGEFKEERVKKAVSELQRIRTVLREQSVDSTLTTATSAFRESNNSKEVLGRLEKALGDKITLISGEREAELILLAIQQNVRPLPDSYATIDIGGGSSEICLVKNEKTEQLASLPLGAIRIQQEYLLTNPPSQSCIEKAQKEIRTQLSFFKWLTKKTLIGSSGTVKTLKTLGKLERTENEAAGQITAFNNFITKLSKMSAEQIATHTEIAAGKADIILAGALILQETLAHFKSEQLLFSPYSLRHGILAEALKKISAPDF